MIGIGSDAIDSFEIHRPNTVVREFKTLDACLSHCRFIEPVSFHVDKGHDTWTLQYVRNWENE